MQIIGKMYISILAQLGSGFRFKYQEWKGATGRRATAGVDVWSTAASGSTPLFTLSHSIAHQFTGENVAILSVPLVLRTAWKSNKPTPQASTAPMITNAMISLRLLDDPGSEGGSDP
eukprot:scpid6591/ scgid9849/ 